MASGVLLLAAMLLISTDVWGLRMMSFNVRQFGTTKFSNLEVVDRLVQIFRQYDVGILIELQNVQMTVLPRFVEKINNVTVPNGIHYQFNVSARVGRSSQKEQYAFIYRSESIEVLDTYLDPDVDDLFERPPYAVLMRCTLETCGDLPHFFVLASHTRPDDAVAEINSLLPAFNSAAAYFRTSRGVIMGDLNADCSYVSKTAFSALVLFTNTSFTWWIDSNNDTTTSDTHCAYDRIITYTGLTEYVVPGSASVVRFDSDLGLTVDQTKAVSDHYPVELSIRGQPRSVTIFNTTQTTTSTTTTTTTPTGSSVVVTASGTMVILLLLISSLLYL